MPQKSLTAATAVSLLFLLAASVCVWIEFGEVAASVIRNVAGG